jgi:signal transduction histidine kinase
MSRIARYRARLPVPAIHPLCRRNWSEMHRWNRLSLAAKLPLTIGILLLLACGTMTAVTYRYVRTSATDLAVDRLELAATRVSELITQSARTRLAQLQLAAGRASAAEYLRRPSEGQRAVLTSVLAEYVGKSQTPVAVELWDAEYRTVAQAGVAFETVPPGTRRAWLAPDANPRGTIVPFRRSGERLVYAVIVPVYEDEYVVGHLVERRVVAQSGQAAAMLTGLIGEEAVLLLGNARDEIWTDTTRIVSLPDAARSSGAARYRRADGAEALVHTVAVADTPWMVAAEFPVAIVMRPATRFLRTALGALVLLSAGGAFVGWVVCQRMTTPLRQLTAAAEAIAASGTAPPIATSRVDEVGRLARSFNTMADEVTQGRQRLEGVVAELDRRVRERTTALEQANGELEAFSYSVSHDLRAPLRAIDGFGRILVEDHAAELSAEARKCLDVINHRTKHMGQLIDDLLTFSRLGRHPLTRGPVDMTAIARSSMDEAARSNAHRLISTVVHPLPSADGERSLVGQVFENLVQNAFKFTRTRATAVVEIGHEVRDGLVLYYVRDNGVGFDMQYADKLFGVFQRLHRAEDFEGTGVGLAIVDRIIRRHGGRVWADATVDGGATFYFTLPEESSRR